MAQDRRLRFEVGYGLEGQVPDALAGRVIEQIIVPRIQGVTAPVRSPNGREAARPLTLARIIVYGIIGIVLLIILATNPSLAVWLLMSMMSGGNRRGGGGGFGGGGGGFGGGGGRSGGGGASGSW